MGSNQLLFQSVTACNVSQMPRGYRCHSCWVLCNYHWPKEEQWTPTWASQFIIMMVHFTTRSQYLKTLFSPHRGIQLPGDWGKWWLPSPTEAIVVLNVGSAETEISLLVWNLLLWLLAVQFNSCLHLTAGQVPSILLAVRSEWTVS